MNLKDQIHVCSSATAERWRLVPASNKFLVTSVKLLDAYVNNLRAGRVTAIVAGSYEEYRTYVRLCDLRLDHLRYVLSADTIDVSTVVIRTGMYWNRTDRNALDTRMARMSCVVYDDWAP